MTIQYCSDLHLEFPENESYLRANPITPGGEILLLAGDIVPFAVMDQYNWFFDYVADHFDVTYWLPGNHEYYRSNVLERCGSFKETIRSNVYLLNNEVVQHNDVTLILSTLWSAISPVAEWDISQSIADYKLIKYGKERFSPLNSHRIHKDSCRFIEEAVRMTNGKTVVGTHHVPTYLNYPEQHRGSKLSEAFATELFPFIETSGVNSWIYGHHHHNTPEFVIGQTKMLTNQLGYVRDNEYLSYKSNACLDI